ncbi:hypothetical protein LWI29_034270 [Acer saccharum]|uniref:Proteasome endopeptidase complex n=1 Tax=Acer saccharum TaxID=4024 RepID=A0AA39S588_ACESA|nr:hypothetical protein LWI29_034270 [Acer saccharum]
MRTTIGVTYNGGVVLGTSSGMYVTELTDNVYAAGDSQIVSDYVGYLLDQHTIQLGQPATVKVAANLVSNSRNMLLQTGSGKLIIVGGWDKYEGGKIYGVGVGGLIEQAFAIGGSGSSYLFGFLDQAWKQGITKQEAEQLVVKSLSLATAGVVRTVTINSEGVTTNFYRPGEDLEARSYTSLLDLLNAPAPDQPVNI